MFTQKKTERIPQRDISKDQDTFFCTGYYRKEGNDYACTIITIIGNVLTNIVHEKGCMPLTLDLKVCIQFLEDTFEERIALCQTYPPDKVNSEPTTL